MKECTSHHRACDCRELQREKHIKELLELIVIAMKALENISTPSALELTRDTTDEDQIDFWHHSSSKKLNLANEALEKIREGLPQWTRS